MTEMELEKAEKRMMDDDDEDDDDNEDARKNMTVVSSCLVIHLYRGKHMHEYANRDKPSNGKWEFGSLEILIRTTTGISAESFIPKTSIGRK